MVKKIFSRSITYREVLFVFVLVFCVSPLASPPIALAVGLVISFTVGHPFIHLNHKATKILLQTSKVKNSFIPL